MNREAKANQVGGWYLLPNLGEESNFFCCCQKKSMCGVLFKSVFPKILRRSLSRASLTVMLFLSISFSKPESFSFSAFDSIRCCFIVAINRSLLLPAKGAFSFNRHHFFGG